MMSTTTTTITTPSISPQAALPPNYTSPPLTIILTVILLVFFFMGFFSVYFCRCLIQNVVHVWQFRRNPSGIIAVTNAQPLGLDPLTIESFPIFAFSTVKGFRRKKYGLECAICLAEFEDDDQLRLLTVCYHVFHQECIDLWLSSHKTCPVCRRELDSLNELEKSPRFPNDNESSPSDSVTISIKDLDCESRGNENEMTQNERQMKLDNFVRSHSTGHSIARSKKEIYEEEEEEEEEEDRHRLRLKENVMIEIIRGRHHSTVSCMAFGEISRTRNGGFGEISSTQDMKRV